MIYFKSIILSNNVSDQEKHFSRLHGSVAPFVKTTINLANVVLKVYLPISKSNLKLTSKMSQIF